ncbi:MAG: HDOD domain-containing protein [Gammaproteobacteria bacterium]|nr:HDOD domain-containing protein [Gammaproteobacteria bacterium]
MMAIAADSVAPGFVEQVVAEIEEDKLELPGFPEAVLRIQRTLQSPDASVDDVVKLLSSEPALAAQALRIANSVAFRRRDGDITDLRGAVNRIGFNLVRTIAVAFAIQQLRLRETYSQEARAEIASIWRDSLSTASICFVLARHCTQLNADQALLAGLLHVLGRLYLVMRAESGDAPAGDEALGAALAWHAEIGKAILAGWGLSESLQSAIEHQDDVDYEAEAVSLTDVLIAAKLLDADAGADAADFPVLQRLTAVRGRNPVDVLTERAEEIRELRSSLGA